MARSKSSERFDMSSWSQRQWICNHICDLRAVTCFKIKKKCFQGAALNMTWCKHGLSQHSSNYSIRKCIMNSNDQEANLITDFRLPLTRPSFALPPSSSHKHSENIQTSPPSVHNWPPTRLIQGQMCDRGCCDVSHSLHLPTSGITQQLHFNCFCWL